MSDFGNEQDFSVHDKENPTLGPTEEAQDVASLDRIVVPMPAFNDPSRPEAASGTINLSLNDHPVQHSEDYGADVMPGTHEVQNPLSDALRELGEEMGGDVDRAAGAHAAADLPEDREEWTKKDWQAMAKSYGLATSGNMDTLQKRVEDHEAAQEERDNWSKEVKGMSRDELDKLAGDYDLDPAEYSTKDELAQAILDAEYGSDGQ